MLLTHQQPHLMAQTHQNNNAPGRTQKYPSADPKSSQPRSKNFYGTLHNKSRPSLNHTYNNDQQQVSEPIASYFDIPRDRRAISGRPFSPHPLSQEYKEDDADDSRKSSSTENFPTGLGQQKPFQLHLSNKKAVPLREDVSPELVKSPTLPQKPKMPVDRPSLIRFYSTPTLPCLSPTRQQFRLPNSSPRIIKETLDASFRIDETGKTINQYLIKEEIGRGSFGTVWRVIDTNTQEQFVS